MTPLKAVVRVAGVVGEQTGPKALQNGVVVLVGRRDHKYLGLQATQHGRPNLPACISRHPWMPHGRQY